jgi:hypothetical protein
MTILTTDHGFIPYGGARVIGGADDPVTTDEFYPPLIPASTVTVGVIDTGVVLDRRRRPHPWFGAHHLSYCAEEDEDVLARGTGPQASSDGHGTFVAGVVLREAPSARVRMWGVLDKARVPTEDGSLLEQDDTAVAAAIGALAINRHVQVINLSFGGGVWHEKRKPARLESALESLFALRQDIAVVASAGNESIEGMVWPAAFPNVISVGALDEGDQVARGSTPPIAPFSNRGQWIKAFASGVRVLGPYSVTGSGAGWARWSGTSFAAAIVSGRIAQVAIERGISGAAAADAVLSDSDPCPKPESQAVWVRSVDSLPFAP